jgi:hypothetical protein
MLNVERWTFVCSFGFSLDTLNGIWHISGWRQILFVFSNGSGRFWVNLQSVRQLFSERILFVMKDPHCQEKIRTEKDYPHG